MSSHEADHQTIKQLTRIADALEKIQEAQARAEERQVAAAAADADIRRWRTP